MGREKTDSQRRAKEAKSLSKTVKLAATQLGAEAGDKFRTIRQYVRGKPIKVGSPARLRATDLKMMKGAGVGLAAAQLAHEGFKLGRKITKKVRGQHKKKILAQESERAKNIARSIQIKHERKKEK